MEIYLNEEKSKFYRVCEKIGLSVNKYATMELVPTLK